MASVDLVQSTTLYQSPIAPSQSNVRVVENRIVVDAPHTAVFDFIATWSNLGEWLPMTSFTKVIHGEADRLVEVGDVLYEGIKPEYNTSAKIYTVMAKVPGVLYVLQGTDEGDPWVRWVAHLSATPLEGNKTLFCRIFQQNCKDATEDAHAVTDPLACQEAVERVKAAVEERQRSS